MTCVSRKLHAQSGIIGKIATQTSAGIWVLGHFMARGLYNTENTFKVIRFRQGDTLVMVNSQEHTSV